MNAAALRQSTATGASIHPDQILGRRSAPDRRRGRRLSFGTYFNAFPARYWRRWTIVTDVTLTVTLAGRGAAVTVYRSMANGRSQRVDSGATDEGGPRHLQLRAAAEAVRGRRLVLVRRGRR